MKKELELFQKITKELLDKEIDEPVVKPLHANTLWEKVNIL